MRSSTPGESVRSAFSTARADARGRRPEPPDHVRNRRRIERVAESLFAARGFRGTSIHLVAARSQCSVGYLYNLYDNKLGLYQAILETKMAKLGGIVENAVSLDAPVPQRLGDLLAELLGFFEENSAFFRIFAVETGVRLWQSRVPFIDRIGQWHAEMLEQVARLVQEGRERGELRAGIDSGLAAVSLLGMVKGHTMDWVSRGEKGSLPERAGGILALSLHGLSAHEGGE